MKGKKPVVFISSTVYDFRDLRSAIKFWLELHGYDVHSSESNDFPQQPDKNSYYSCLRVIDDSDYFVLLIGNRVGGWFDQERKISITRAEYQHAYERARQGKLKLVIFVRKDVWDVREDRNELRKFLQGEEAKDLNLSPDAVKKIAGAPSKFANEPDAIFEFLKEVSRIHEMKAASAGQGEFPPGNWINQFSTFRDITDALKASIRITGTLQQAALVANLKYEIVLNMKRMLAKNEEMTVYPITTSINSVRRNLSGDIDGSSVLTRREFARVGIFLMMYSDIANRFSTFALHEAIVSGQFLSFDVAADSYVVGKLQKCLIEAAGLIHSLKGIQDRGFEIGAKYLQRHRSMTSDFDAPTEVKNHELVVAISLRDQIHNLAKHYIAIYHYFVSPDDRYFLFVPWPDIPFHEEAKNVENETPKLPEVEAWIRQFGLNY